MNAEDGGEPQTAGDRAVWSAEGIAICAALAVLVLAFLVNLGLNRLLPDSLEWVVLSTTAVVGFWLAVRAYRHALRRRGLDPGGLGVRLGSDQPTRDRHPR